MAPLVIWRGLFFGAAMARTAAAAADTVIHFADGSSYTLEGEQQIYISTPSSALFKRQLWKNKDTWQRGQQQPELEGEQQIYISTPSSALGAGRILFTAESKT